MFKEMLVTRKFFTLTIRRMSMKRMFNFCVHSEDEPIIIANSNGVLVQQENDEWIAINPSYRYYFLYTFNDALTQVVPIEDGQEYFLTPKQVLVACQRNIRYPGRSRLWFHILDTDVPLFLRLPTYNFGEPFPTGAPAAIIADWIEDRMDTLEPKKRLYVGACAKFIRRCCLR